MEKSGALAVAPGRMRGSFWALFLGSFDGPFLKGAIGLGFGLQGLRVWDFKA